MKDHTIKIIIAAHKKYKMPSDQMYIPLHVGAEGKIDINGNPLNVGYQKDNTGDNISNLNPSFCELTGLYWAWKNLDADYIGLVHYRRHFSMKKRCFRRPCFKDILTFEQIEPYLGKIKIFVPSKRKYYIETLYSHYAHTHYPKQLDETRNIIHDRYPAYLSAYDDVLKRTYGYMFNMIIMETVVLDNYCSWLFAVLFELRMRMEQCDDMLELSAFQGRYFGRVSEILLNVWLEQQIRTGAVDKYEVMELPYIHMEKVNWWKKGTAFLKAKFIGKKYEGSF